MLCWEKKAYQPQYIRVHQSEVQNCGTRAEGYRWHHLYPPRLQKRGRLHTICVDDWSPQLLGDLCKDTREGMSEPRSAIRRHVVRERDLASENSSSSDSRIAEARARIRERAIFSVTDQTVNSLGFVWSYSLRCNYSTPLFCCSQSSQTHKATIINLFYLMAHIN